MDQAGIGSGAGGEDTQKRNERGVAALRSVLLKKLEQKLGPLPEAERRRIAAISSVAEVSALLAGLRAGAGEAPPLRPGAAGERAPLSFSQQRLWFLDRWQPGNAAYNIPLALLLEGTLSVAALARSLGEIARRHAVLRTVYRETGDGPVQQVLPWAPVALPVVDLAFLPAARREAEAERWLGQETQRGFDLAAGPVFRLCLLRLAGARHLLLATMHHIASDGWSMARVVEELGELYPAYAQRRPPHLPELAVQYADYAVWQRQWLSGEELERELAYWRQRLSGVAPVLELPADRPRPPLESFHGARSALSLPPAVAGRIEALCRQEGLTAFTLLLGAFQVLLWRWTGEERFAVGTPVAGRLRPELESLIGCFVNTVVTTGDLAGNPTFLALLRRLREEVIAGQDHQHLPFDKLVEELVSERSLAHSPVFQVLFTLQTAPSARLELPGLTAGRWRFATGVAKFDLTLDLGKDGERWAGGIEYRTELWDSTTALRFAAHFERLVERLVAEPERAVAELPWWGEAERQQLLVEWNDRPALPAGGFTGVFARFAAQAVATPKAVALECGEEVWTYHQLAAAAGRIAAAVAARGAGAECVVGVFLERRPRLIAALLGVLGAGAAYLPLDPSWPRERLAYILADSGAGWLLTDRSLAPEVAGFAGEILLAEEIEAEAGAAVGAGAAVLPEQLAYVIYTSGSTGKPKGVGVRHGGVAALLDWGEGCLTAADVDGVLGSTSVNFDISVFELFSPLTRGGRIALVRDLLALREGVAGIRTICAVPSVLAELLRLAPLPATIETVLFCGEAVPAELVTALAAAGTVRRIVNLYGPTEDTVYATLSPLSAGEPVRIGRPLTGGRVRVLDPWGSPVPVGVAGELHLGGSRLARGYLNRPEVTAERFVPDPWAGEAGARTYRTGDRVCFRPDGRLDFLGRLDHQVKLRGFRIEPGEIEAVLSRFPGVAETAVVVCDLPRAAGSSERGLVAFWSPRPGAGGIGTRELREHLRRDLPEGWIPGVFVELPALPRTPSGKLDRRALPALLTLPAGAEDRYVAPRDAQEELLAQLFAEILGAERVGACDNFFDLGGHSLLVAQLVARIRALFGQELALRQVFETPTVAGLAETLRQASPSPAAPPIVAVPRQPGDELPLSFAQQRLWFLDRFEPGSAAYNIPLVLHLTGAPRVDLLAAAFTELVRRHAVLRTVYGERDGAPVQRLEPARPVALSLLDLSGLSAPVKREEGERRSREETGRGFDLEQGPVYRLVLLRLSAAEHVLLATVHHIASDGWSTGVMTRELGAIYGALVRGEAPRLPDLPVQYGDYASWQRQWLAGEVLAGELAFWRERLAGLAPVLDLPLDRPRPPAEDFAGAHCGVALSAAASRRVEDLCRQRGVTPFMLLLGAFEVLLWRWTGEERFAVGTPMAGRSHVELEGLIGFFVNTLVFASDLSSGPTFVELLGRLREEALEVQAHQSLPFDRLVEELAPERSLAHSPVFQAMFTLQTLTAALPELPDLEIGRWPFAAGMAKFELTLNLGRVGDRWSGGLEYRTSLWDRTTALRFAAHFERLVAGLVEEPERPVAELPWWGEAERQQLLVEWNDRPALPAGDFTDVFARFAARAAVVPEAVALECGEEVWTYHRLAAAAGRIAAAVAARGAGAECVVGVFLERRPRLIAALLGVLGAGAAYLPLDPSWPRERLAYILADSGAGWLLTDRSLAPEVAGFAGEILLAEEIEAETGAAIGAGAAVLPEQLAYVIYTSGSTGKPKGVGVRHGGVAALLDWGESCLAAADVDGVLGSTSVNFDISVFELFSPLTRGGRIALVRDLLALREGVAGIRTICAVPSVLAELLRLAPLPATIETVLFCGEAVPAELVTALAAAGTVRRIVNLYGPTEDTVYATLAPLSAGEPVRIGRPLTGGRVRVLDPWGSPVPVGVAGELHLGGSRLARGYLNRPEVTAEWFVPDPWAGEAGARTYRTGDRVCFRPDGRLDFLGRLDHQVKLRGFRIEPGEIEAVLSRFPGVAETAVVVCDLPRAGGSSERGLVAFCALGSAALRLDRRELREYLRRHLPEGWIPGAFVELAALPRTPSGKLDRRALPALLTLPAAAEGLSAAPRNAREELLAQLFGQVLGVERVGLFDDFFDLGGHSLLVAQLVARIRELFGHELALRDVFEAPTVAGLAGKLEQASSTPSLPPIAAVPRRPGDELPLSFAQQRLWFLDRWERGNGIYNIPLVLHLTGAPRVGLLAAAFAELVRRHAVLRTVYGERGGVPVQRLEPAQRVALSLIDLSGLAAPLRRREGERRSREETGRGFDLERGPVYRLVLLRLSAAEHVLLATVHHIATDGWSTGVMARELGAIYGALVRGEAPHLPDLPVQYGDYASWQRQWLAGEVLAGELAFWRERLAGLPPLLDLPLDRPRPPVEDFAGAHSGVALSAAVSRQVEELCRRQGVTPFMLLLGAFEALLWRWTGDERLAVGTPMAGRSHVELEGLIGFFVNTLVFASDLTGNPTFAELLGRLREESLEVQSHQSLPFDRLVEELAPERSLAYSPVFQAMFALQTAAASQPELPGLAVGRWPFATGVAKFELKLDLGRAGDRWAGGLEFRTALWDRTTALRFAAHYARLVARLVEAPERPVAELPWWEEVERQQLTVEWRGGAALPPREFAGVYQRFAAQAAATPEAVAVECGGEGWTYRRLAAAAGRFAAALAARGAGAECVVGVYLERRPRLLAALLGVLGAGAAYLPLDPSWPEERLKLLLEDAGAGWLVTERALARPAGFAGELILAEDLEEGEIGTGAAVLPEQLAFVIYTSGSTGRPKGVGVRHGGVAALLDGSAELVAAGDLDGVLAATSVSFDVSVFELFAPLTRGGRIVLVRDLLSLAEGVSGVRTLCAVPSVLSELLRLAPLPAGVENVLLGGEAVPAELVTALAAAGTVRRILNLYGPTEDTVYATVAPLSAGEPVRIGRPLPGGRMQVVDRWGLPVPLGVAGELHLGGERLARGYLHRPELTAERFVPDPGSGEAGARTYRTGDRVRFRADGRLESLGRLDHQVKIRGLRIEPGEIEAVLSRFPGVAETAVVVCDLPRASGSSERGLVAFCALGSAALRLDRRELREYLRRHLPEGWIPGAFVELAALPRTPSGKLDRRALPALLTLPAAAEGFAAPRNAREELLAQLFGQVLGVERAGLFDDFFDLGGHSLLVAQLVARIRELFGQELALRDVFEAPTVAGLAEKLEQASSTPSLPPIAAVPRRPGDELPLSFAQQRLWFLDRWERGNGIYNIPLVLHLTGAPRVGLLAAAFTELVRRHAVLRTVYGERGGVPVQRLEPAQPVALSLIDLSGLAAPVKRVEGERRSREETGRGFDLEQGPVYRLVLLRLSAAEHVLLATVHHIASDGWSTGVMTRELGAIYGALVRGEAPHLPDLPVQYGDYAAWQRQWLAGEVLAAELAFWRERLAGLAPLLDLPLDRPRPPVEDFAGARCGVALSAAVSRQVEALCRRQGVTPFMLLLGAFEALLWRWTGEERFAVGTPMAGRSHVELEGLIGFFANTLVFAGDLTGNPTFVELLGRLREESLAVQSHQSLPFDRLVEELAPERSLAYSPVFQAMFTLQTAAASQPELPGLAVGRWPFATGMAKFELTLDLGRAGERWAGTLEHRTALWDRTTALRFAAHYARLVARLVEAPERPVAELPWWEEVERQQLTVEWSRGAAPPSREFAGVYQRFAAQAAATPEAVAVEYGGEAWTYRRLAAAAGRFTAALAARGAGAECVVGVYLERRPRLLAALLGVLGAGAAYLPLDPSWPEGRLAFLLEDSGAGWLVSERALARPAGFAGELILAEDLEEGEIGPGAAVLPEQLAYVIYTSGSTGRPKGVGVRHGGVAALLDGSAGFLAAGDLDGVLGATSVSFDVSVFELFVPLTRGGRIVLVRDLLALAEGVAGVRTLCAVPSVLSELLRLGPLPATVGSVLLAGEAVPADLVTALAAAGVRRVVDLYGPTEDTVYATREELAAGAPVRIGRPLPGGRVQVLDRRGLPVPVGVAGELHLGGERLARGYVNRPEVTAERFVPDPWAGERGARTYRTGDRVRFRADGRLDYLGRLDQQVKIRGVRIEPGEIEAVLVGFPGVAEAVVTVCELPERALAAYLAAPAPLALGELRAYLRRHFPEAWIPAFFVELPALPRTPSGKLDRRALPAPERASAEGPRREVAGPLEEILLAIWAELLSLPAAAISPLDDFFAIGGHSLLAIQMIARIRGSLGLDLELREAFQYPTLEGMARRLRALGQAAAGVPAEPIRPGPRPPEGIPLSFAQQRLWLMYLLEPESPRYNLPTGVRLRGPFVPGAFLTGVAHVIRRHEILAARIEARDGVPVQLLERQAEIAVPRVDLTGLAGERREREARRLLADVCWRPFDLSRGPLWRALLVELAADDHAFGLGLHHIVADGLSSEILVKEVAAAYRAFAAGDRPQLKPLPIQYPDFVHWQRQVLSGESLERELAYWRRQLDGLPPRLDLPMARPRPERLSSRGRRRTFVLDRTLAQGLAALAERRHATLFMVGLAAWQALLYRVSASDDFCVGIPVAGRDRPEVEPLVGFFVNMLPIRARVAGHSSFAELLGEVRETTLAALSHQDLPFDLLVEAQNPERSASHAPLFQVVFQLLRQPRAAAMPGGLAVESWPLEFSVANFDLSLLLLAGEREWLGSLDYSTDLFEPAAIDELLKRYEDLLRQVVSHPESPLLDLPPAAPVGPESEAGGLAAALRGEQFSI